MLEIQLLGSLLAATLMIGDPAPPLPVTEWLQRPQPAIVQPGHVTVVEFWATWCGPCLPNIPHLSALQKKYQSRGLVVVGATSPDEWGNDKKAVQSLMAAKQTVFDYPVAWLPPNGGKNDGIFRNPWSRAAALERLPIAFVIDDKGRVAFIGEPLMLDEVVDKLINHRWDLAAARSKYVTETKAREELEQMQKAIEGGDRQGALRYARAAAAGGKDDPQTLLIVASALSNTKKGKPSPDELDVALRAAERGVMLTKSQSSGMFDLLAHVWFVRGDAGKAVEFEKRAIALSEGPMRDAQQKNLVQYKAARK